MSRNGDDVGGMGIIGLADEAIEAYFLGDSHHAWEGDAALASLAEEVLMGATGPAPSPSSALRAFLGEPDAAPATEVTRPLAAVPPSHADTVEPGPTTSDPGTNVVPLFRRLRLTVGIAAAAGAAAAALTVAGTTGALPEPVMQAVSWVVEAVTPFELHEPARTVTGDDDVSRQGPTSAVPGGAFGPAVGAGPAGSGGAASQPAATMPAGPSGAPGQPVVAGSGVGQGDAPGQPAVTPPASPPASMPAGVPSPAQPPGAGVDRGGQSSRPSIPLPPASPTGISPPAGGESGTPPTMPDVRSGQVPVGGTSPAGRR